MIFNSLAFMVFFCAVILGVLVIQIFTSGKGKRIFLLCASFFFYGWWDWRFCFLLLSVIAISYITAINSKSRLAYFAGVSVPIIALGIFKYFGFFTRALGLSCLSPERKHTPLKA